MLFYPSFEGIIFQWIWLNPPPDDLFTGFFSLGHLSLSNSKNTQANGILRRPSPGDFLLPEDIYCFSTEISSMPSPAASMPNQAKPQGSNQADRPTPDVSVFRRRFASTKTTFQSMRHTRPSIHPSSHPSWKWSLALDSDFVEMTFAGQQTAGLCLTLSFRGSSQFTAVVELPANGLFARTDRQYSNSQLCIQHYAFGNYACKTNLQ